MSTWKLAGAAVLVALLVAWTLQSLVMGSPSAAPPVATSPVVTNRSGEDEAVDPDPGPVVAAGEVAGVPAGYPQSTAGAATAAVNWVASVPTFLQMGPLVLSDALDTLLSTTADRSLFDDTVALYFELLAEFGPEFRERLWTEAPLRSSVTSSTSERVEVAVWSVLVTGDTVDGPVEMLWRTHRLGLVWERSDWRIASVSVVEGPTPIGVDAAVPSEPGEFDGLNDWVPAVFADTTLHTEDE